MVYVKKNATICKICATLFDKKSHRTFIVCTGSAGIWYCGTFCQKDKGCGTSQDGASQDGASQDGALRRGHQSAALLVEEKRRTCRHVFKCRCVTFVAFFLMYTVHTSSEGYVHV